MWFAWSANTPSGPSPTGTVAGVCPQPEVTCALQVAPLNTETVLSPKLVTYTVSVCWSIAIPLGRFPTVIVGQGPCAARDVLRLAVTRVDHRDRVPDGVRSVRVEAVRHVDRVRARIDRERRRAVADRRRPHQRGSNPNGAPGIRLLSGLLWAPWTPTRAASGFPAECGHAHGCATRTGGAEASRPTDVPDAGLATGARMAATLIAARRAGLGSTSG